MRADAARLDHWVAEAAAEAPVVEQLILRCVRCPNKPLETAPLPRHVADNPPASKMAIGRGKPNLNILLSSYYRERPEDISPGDNGPAQLPAPRRLAPASAAARWSLPVLRLVPLRQS